MLVDDLKLEIVVAEHLGLDAQAFLGGERARADTDGIPLFASFAQNALGILRDRWEPLAPARRLWRSQASSVSSLSIPRKSRKPLSSRLRR